MNTVEFCEKYGDKYSKKIKEWYQAGYLGNTTKDEKTGRYDIPEDIPLPFSANPNVSTIPTLLRDILIAASNENSIFSSMYPKLPNGTFDRVLQECVDSKFIRVCHTDSGDSFLELQIEGMRFLSNYTEIERKRMLNKLGKFLSSGISLLAALLQLGIVS